MDLSVIIFGIAGIILFITTVKVLTSLIRMLAAIISGCIKCKTPVTAKVIDRKSIELDPEEEPAPKYKYSYTYLFTLNGNDYNVKSKMWYFVPFVIGETVQLYVDESNPDHIFEKGILLVNLAADVLVGIIIFTLALHELPLFIDVLKAVL